MNFNKEQWAASIIMGIVDYFEYAPISEFTNNEIATCHIPTLCVGAGNVAFQVHLNTEYIADLSSDTPTVEILRVISFSIPDAFKHGIDASDDPTLYKVIEEIVNGDVREFIETTGPIAIGISLNDEDDFDIEDFDWNINPNDIPN